MLVWLLKTLLKIVRHSLVLSSLFYLSVLIALLIYHLFYQWYMPKAKIERNIEFELKLPPPVYPHEATATTSMPPPYAAQPYYYNPHHHYQHFTAELIAHVSLFERQGESLHSGQEYSLALALEVPESEANFEIGMFGITVDIVDVEGRLIVTYKTMGTLVYKSALLRMLTTLVYFPWYLIGRFEQKQTISLMIKENFIDNAVNNFFFEYISNGIYLLLRNIFKYMPANKIVIRVSDKLQYYTAVLSIEAKFSGLKFYLNRWYYTLSFFICFGLTFITFIILLSSCFDLKSMLFEKEKRLPNSECNLTMKIFFIVVRCSRP